MMCKMQTKIKDTNLRNIDTFKKQKKPRDSDKELEEYKNGVSNTRFSRNRTNSALGISIANNIGRSAQINNKLFASITAAIGVEGEDPYKIEAKKRGMSDVDDTNIKQLKDNTSNMIQTQLQKMMSSISKNQNEESKSPKKL